MKIRSFRVKKSEKLKLDEVWLCDRDGQKENVLIKVVVEDEASASLAGKIAIAKNVSGVEAFLRYKILLLGERSRVEVVPQLEIESNEVKAGHAASIGRVDEEQLFYLMSRGILRSEAIELVVEAFLDDNN